MSTLTVHFGFGVLDYWGHNKIQNTTLATNCSVPYIIKVSKRYRCDPCHFDEYHKEFNEYRMAYMDLIYLVSGKYDSVSTWVYFLVEKCLLGIKRHVHDNLGQCENYLFI
jgi:hypothetical protein